MSERKIHVLEDGDLGGVLREYVEVDCRLEPTDIVHIDGQRYRMVDREAKVGERIIIVNGSGWYRDKVGYIYDVIHPSKYDFDGNDNSGAYVEYEKNAYNDVIHFVRRGNYRVLEPVEPIEIVTPEEGDDKSVLDLLANLSRRSTELERKLTETNKSQAHPQVIEMLANLSRRIVALEKKIARLEQTDNSLHRDIETWAQEVERLKGRTKTELRGDRGMSQQLPGYICDFSIKHSCEGCYRVDFTVKGAPTRESVEKSLKEVLDLIYDSAEEE